MINTYNGQILRDVGGIEITKESENPRFALTLSRGRILADEAEAEAIRIAMAELTLQRFFNSVELSNRYPTVTQVYMF